MTPVLSKEDFIHYILNNLEPEKSTRFFLNKLAFLVEFAYMYYNQGEKELTDAQYAAIKHGPVIDGYKELLEDMSTRGLIKLDGDKDIRLLSTKEIKVPEDVAVLAKGLIKKYSPLSFEELKAITHETDSYKITTNNEADIEGKIIDKNLAVLETFFDDTKGGDLLDEASLPDVDKGRLVPYEFGPASGN